VSPSSSVGPTLRGLFCIAGVLACLGGPLFVGCDETRSQRESLYQRLSNEGEGPWRIEELDGSLTPDLGGREIRIAFRQGDGKTYRITERLSADSTVVLASGAVVLPGGDDLRMGTGFGRFGPVTWSYSFEASRAVFALQRGSRPFLQALFPETAWSDELDVEMTLAPVDE